MEADSEVATNYHTLEAEVIAELSTRDRFAPIEERQDTGVLALDVISTISHGKYQTFWRGVSLMKDPLDQTILQQLLWELKPRTVIEFGAYKGGSALWIADLLKLFGCQSRVVSIDIDLSLLDAEARKSSDVEFIQGDSFQVEKVLSSTFLENLHHPWLVMEDAHVNLVGVLEYLDKFIEPGDYICVEDSNPLAPGAGQGLVKTRGYKAYGPSKMNELRKFLTGRSDRYLVDQKYTDFFGYNATWNMNGYLKRV